MLAGTRREAVALVVAALGWAMVAAAQPANDDCSNATVIGSLPFSDLGVDMTTATTEPGDPVSLCAGGQGTSSVWYRVPAGEAQDLFRGITGGTTTDFHVAIWSGTCGALTELNCYDTEPAFPEFGVAPQGQEVLIEILNAGTAGTLDLDLDRTPEFLVRAGGTRRVHMGGGPNGFLVTYPGPDYLEGRLYDPSGNALGPAFTIDTDFWIPHDTAGAGDGSFFVVSNTGGTEAARVDGTGVVTPFPSISVGGYPVVAADSVGNFVVAWEGTGIDGSGFGVTAQRFDRDGTPLGPAFQANTYTTGSQQAAAVAMAPNGDFVIVWHGLDDGDGDGIAARLFDASGTPLGDEFVVNQYTTLDQSYPAVGMDATGNFVVVWEGNGYRYVEGTGYFDIPVAGRRFDAAGTPLGAEFIVNSDTTYYGVTGYLDVAVAAAGEFMVTWEGFGFTVVDIHARQFEADGTPKGPQFFVNTVDGYSSYEPDVAATPAGDFLVAWHDFRGFFSDSFPPEFRDDGILARHFPAAGIGCSAAAKPGCRTPTIPLKSKLLLLDRPDDTDDQFRWKFVKGDATDAADLGDPTTDEDYVLCLYDASSAAGALLLENRIPAGGTCGTKPCWKALGNPAGSKGYRYKDNDRTPHGIQKMVLKPGPAGKSKVVLKGGQEHVFDGGPGTPILPLTLPVTVQLQNASGACWQATYDTAGTGVNEAGFFKGSGS